MTARTHDSSLSNFISLSEAKKLNLELQPLRSNEKYIIYNTGARKYKAEARVEISFRVLGNTEISSLIFFVIRSNNLGILLNGDALRTHHQRRAIENDIGCVEGPPPPPIGDELAPRVSILPLLPNALYMMFASLGETRRR